jgi:hypothetical protein
MCIKKKKIGFLIVQNNTNYQKEPTPYEYIISGLEEENTMKYSF